MKEFPFLTVGGPSGVLTDFPSKLLENGNFRGYPTIGGSVKHPGVCDAMRGKHCTVFTLSPLLILTIFLTLQT